MATAPVYILLSNDGDDDFVLTADAKLHTRLQEVRDTKTKAKMQGRLPPNVSVQPQISDVTESHNLWVHRRFYPYVALSHTFLPTQVWSGSANLASGGQLTFDMQYSGEFYNKACVHLVINGGTIASNGADRQYWAWHPFLGHKLIKDAELVVNTTSLDKYDSKAAQSHFEFDVKDSIKEGYMKCVGQQVPKKGRVNQFATTAGLTTRTLAGGLDGQVPANGVNLGQLGYEEEVTVYDGPQSRSITKGSIELFIPLWFWWNKESEESLCVLTIPNCQRHVKLTMESLNNLVQMYDKNGNPIAYDASKWTVAPTYQTQELLVQNIYVNPEINDVYIDRIGFNMVRLHRYEEDNLVSASFNFRLNQLKWPVEEMRIAAIPRANTLGTAIEDGFTFGYVVPTDFVLAGRWQGDPSTAVTVPLSAKNRVFDDILTELTLTIQGMQLYNAFPAKFFQHFTPTVFSEVGCRSFPKSNGWHMINIAQKPGHDQATGHFNISRMRETYLSGKTVHIPSDVDQATLYTLAICNAFTYATNGNIIIRFIG